MDLHGLPGNSSSSTWSFSSPSFLPELGAHRVSHTFSLLWPQFHLHNPFFPSWFWYSQGSALASSRSIPNLAVHTQYRFFIRTGFPEDTLGQNQALQPSLCPAKPCPALAQALPWLQPLQGIGMRLCWEGAECWGDVM